jgi:hypothetical protein
LLENKLKINLLGEAWKLKQVVFSNALLHAFEEVAKKMKQPLNEVLIDPFFYYYLKNKSIQSIDNLQGNCLEGLINSPKNQIEIWYKNKKVQKLKINDLREELLLFPLYKTIIQKTNLQLEKGFYIEQKEIGLIGSFEIYTDNFIIEYSAVDLALDAALRYQNMPFEFYRDWLEVANDEIRHFLMLEK